MPGRRNRRGDLRGGRSALAPGIWLGTEGSLRVGDELTAQLLLWQDTAPPSVCVHVVATDGLLRLHNVWDSGRGISPYESQAATSGMVREPLVDGCRYRCNDMGRRPTSTSLVVAVRQV